MDLKNKIFKVDSLFTKNINDTDETLHVEGYASVAVPDRAGDLIPTAVWDKGMSNYLKNPILLAYHDHEKPAGRIVEHRVDSRGLWIKGRISKASEIYELVKDGILSAFSVGFRIGDAEFDSVSGLFVVKELELLEISVVAVPCNQDTLFNLSKSFESDEEYNLFKLQFAKEEDTAKGLTPPKAAKSNIQKEIGMDPKELQAMLEASATKAAEAATARILEAQKAVEAEAARKAAEEAELQKRIKEAVAAVTPSVTGAEKLVAELEKRINEQEKTAKEALEGLQGALAEKAKELEAMTKSKMSFKDPAGKDVVTYEEKEKAIMLSKITGKSIEQTKFGKTLAEKALGAGAATGAHLPSQTWEHEVSLQMEEEVRRRLVAAPLMRNITMQTNVMSFPVNPEAGYGTWVTNAQFGTSASSGAAVTHALKEVTLNSYKLATKEYMGFEEEEDSLIVLLPIVRDAMVRRTAKSVDKAILLGAGAGADPVKGLAKYDEVSAVTAQVANKMTVASLRALRKDLGYWGLDPAEVVFIVNTEGYYDLLDDADFQTMDKVGPAATLLTGQIGMVGNSSVIVSAELPAKTAGANVGGVLTNVGAIALNARNFLLGNQRGLRFDTDDDVENQRKVLVASLRMGMQQISTVDGQGVSVFRWLA
jgi:HK97 family phage prohead protease/HK97 family phage major capsid protein